MSLLTLNKLFLCTLLILLMGCKPATTTTTAPPLSSPKCLSSQSPCFIEDEFGKFAVTFDVADVRAEVPFHIIFNYQGKYKIKEVTAFLEGKNMFMGKVPLFFNNVNSEIGREVFDAETMVVACSEPNMVWNLWITVKLIGEDQQSIEKKLLINFTSHY